MKRLCSLLVVTLLIACAIPPQILAVTPTHYVSSTIDFVYQLPSAWFSLADTRSTSTSCAVQFLGYVYDKNGALIQQWSGQGTGEAQSSVSGTIPLQSYYYSIDVRHWCSTCNTAWVFTNDSISGSYITDASSTLSRTVYPGSNGYTIGFSGTSYASVCNSSGVSVTSYLYKNGILVRNIASGVGVVSRSASGDYFDNTPYVGFELRTDHSINGSTSSLTKNLYVGAVDWN